MDSQPTHTDQSNDTIITCALCGQQYDTRNARTSWHVVNVLPDGTLDPQFHRPRLSRGEWEKMREGKNVICHQRNACRLRQKDTQLVRTLPLRHKHTALPVPIPLKSPWRMAVRFRRGIDDDLIAYLDQWFGRRAIRIREATRQAVEAGVTYTGEEPWTERSNGAGQADVRVTVRFFKDQDEHIVDYLQSLPGRKKSSYLRQALRWMIAQNTGEHPAPRATERRS